MGNVNVLGYFKEVTDNKEIKEELLYFVAYENSLNTSEVDKKGGKKWVEGFNVIDGHFQLKDRNYLDECDKISKEDYLKATKSYNTPEIYL